MATEPRGREAVYAASTTADTQPSLVDHQPSTVYEQRTTVDRWEDTHQRVTFYCPTTLLEAVEVEMRRSGRSKSRVIVDALRSFLSESAPD